MKKSKVTFIIVFMICLSNSLTATTLLIKSPEEILEEATFIVEATVLEIKFSPINNSIRGYADITLSVNDLVKGNTELMITMRRHGVDENGFLFVDCAYPYTVGDQIIVALTKHSNGYYKPLGLKNGTFFIQDSFIAGTDISVGDFKLSILEIIEGKQKMLPNNIPRITEESLIIQNTSRVGLPKSTQTLVSHFDGKFVTKNESWDPLFLPVQFYYNPNGDPTTDAIALSSVNEAFNAWNNLSYTHLVFSQLTSSHITTDQGVDNTKSVIFWTDYLPGVLAAEDTYPHEAGMGTIKGSDILFNTDYNPNWYFGSSPPGSRVINQPDFVDVLMHELGHTIGLGHTNISSTLMYGGGYINTTVALRALADGDKAGSVYLHTKNPLPSGTIPHSIVLSAAGSIDAAGDITIPASKTFLIESGKTLRLNSDKKIYVNGNLRASNATITSTGSSWGGIQFNSGSDGDIRYCTIRKVGYGPGYLYIYNSSPYIRSNILDQWAGAYQGIYVRGSTADPTLYDNEIEINYTGVRFDNYAAGELSYNLIHVTNMYDPVLYAVGGAWVDADYRGANTFREGRYGISAQSSARVDASGTFSENDFCETGVYDLYATSSSSIYANYCNFPGASPTTYADGTSTITTQYASNSDGYCSQLSKANTLAGLESPRGEPLHPVDLAALSPLDRAWHGLKTGQLAAAEADFLALLETERAHQALTGLAHVYTRNQSPAIFNTITRLASTAGNVTDAVSDCSGRTYNESA